jgi:hypothetical protein
VLEKGDFDSVLRQCPLTQTLFGLLRKGYMQAFFFFGGWGGGAGGCSTF